MVSHHNDRKVIKAPCFLSHHSSLVVLTAAIIYLYLNQCQHLTLKEKLLSAPPRIVQSRNKRIFVSWLGQNSCVSPWPAAEDQKTLLCGTALFSPKGTNQKELEKGVAVAFSVLSTRVMCNSSLTSKTRLLRLKNNQGFFRCRVSIQKILKKIHVGFFLVNRLPLFAISSRKEFPNIGTQLTGLGRNRALECPHY